MAEFNGFKKSFFEFFEDLKDNNNREWFTENKSRYEDRVVEPLLAFIEAMQPRLKKISPHILAVPKKQGGSMFRIYRDIRFSKDKRPYKEHGACQFRHDAGKDAHAPGFYVHLEPGNIMFGGGIWMPPSETLRNIRTAIANDAAGWNRVKNAKALKETYGDIRGEGLTRPPKGFDADHKHIEDLKRKTFFVMRNGTKTGAAKPQFADDVAKSFRAASPLMRFLCKANGLPY